MVEAVGSTRKRVFYINKQKVKQMPQKATLTSTNNWRVDIRESENGTKLDVKVQYINDNDRSVPASASFNSLGGAIATGIDSDQLKSLLEDAREDAREDLLLGLGKAVGDLKEQIDNVVDNVADGFLDDDEDGN